MVEKLIEFAMCGSEGERCNPYELTASIERQKLLLLINAEPQSIEDIAQRLNLAVEKVAEHLEELLQCGLIREENGFYRPAFAIFTVEDQKTLMPLINELVSDIIEVIGHWLPKIREVLNSFTVVRRSLRVPYLEYIIVGALALDYEGLDVLSEEGLIVKSKKMPGGGNYIFTCFERGFLNLRRTWMWGHHSVFGRYWFNTHGSLPPRGPRIAFPDLAWLWYAQGVDLDTIGSKMVEIGSILEALVWRDLSSKDLRSELGIDSLTLAIDLSLLLSINYVKLIDRDLWRLGIPVLTVEDYSAVKEVSKMMLKDIADRFKRKLRRIKEVYERTSPARNGIPLEEAFNQVYHLVFGQALDELIAENIITEPMKRIDGGKYSAFLIVLSSK